MTLRNTWQFLRLAYNKRRRVFLTSSSSGLKGYSLLRCISCQLIQRKRMMRGSVTALLVWTLWLCSIMPCSKYMDLSFFLVWNLNIVENRPDHLEHETVTQSMHHIVSSSQTAAQFAMYCESPRIWYLIDKLTRVLLLLCLCLEVWLWFHSNTALLRQTHDITFDFAMHCKSPRIRYLVDNWWEYCSRSVVIQRDDINFIVKQQYYNKVTTLRLAYELEDARSSKISYCELM